jgi:hypothetical protein
VAPRASAGHGRCVASRQRRRRDARRRAHARRPGRELVAGAGLSLGAVFALGATAQAATLEVDNTTDDGSAAMQACTATPNDCSLHGATLVSNASTAVTDTITFASTLSGQTISLLGQKNITDGVTISGPGAGALAVSGNDAVRVFNVDLTAAGESVEISGLTIRDGLAPVNETGGAIRNADASLTISGAIVTSSFAGSSGGGIYLANDFANGTQTLIRNSTISGNTGGQGPGGIHAEGSLGSLIHSTVSGNHAEVAAQIAGGVQASAYSYFYSSTIAGNTAGVGVGGVIVGDALFSNTIVADNTGPEGDDIVNDIEAEFSLVENIDAGGSVTPVFGGQNVTGLDPQLGPLAANGGTTPTQLPGDSSVVVDRGFSTLATEQRGLPRAFDVPALASPPGGNGVDIGAVELQASDFAAPEPPMAPKPQCKKKKKKKKKKRAGPAATCKKKKKKKKKK